MGEAVREREKEREILGIFEAKPRHPGQIGGGVAVLLEKEGYPTVDFSAVGPFVRFLHVRLPLVP